MSLRGWREGGFHARPEGNNGEKEPPGLGEEVILGGPKEPCYQETQSCSGTSRDKLSEGDAEVFAPKKGIERKEVRILWLRKKKRTEESPPRKKKGSPREKKTPLRGGEGGEERHMNRKTETREKWSWSEQRRRQGKNP